MSKFLLVSAKIQRTYVCSTAPLVPRRMKYLDLIVLSPFVIAILIFLVLDLVNWPNNKFGKCSLNTRKV